MSSRRASFLSALFEPLQSLPLRTPQKGVQLHNNARKLPQGKKAGGSGVTDEWKGAVVAYLRAAAASLVSLGSTSSPRDW